MNADDLVHLREGWDFEAKLALGKDGRGEVPRSFWETYSAMANAKGGYILLGARELKDGTWRFEGVPDLDRVEGDLWNTLQNPTKVSANLLQARHVERVEIDGCSLLLIQVPPAPRANRPVFLNGTLENGTFMRVHEGDRKLSSERARRLLADAIPNRDANALEELGLTALHVETIRIYREMLAARRPEHAFLEATGPAFLEQIGAVTRSHSDAPWHPTWAGLWMLGTELALRRLNPNWHLSYKEMPDDPNDSRRWLDRDHPDGSWPPNLLTFYRRAMVKVHAGLKVPFRTEGGQFRVDETPVHEALREALINTLVHADHQGTTGIRVLRRRGGFEFINPGLLLVTPEQLWKGGVSEARNPTLQRMFTLLQLGEREGSGGPAMRQAWRAQHWRVPRIWLDAEHQETHLDLSTESLLPGEVIDALLARFGDAFTGQDELGRLILTEAEQSEEVDHARLCEMTEAHPRDVTLKIQDLLRRDLLLRAMSGRRSTYRRAGRTAGSGGRKGNLSQSSARSVPQGVSSTSPRGGRALAADGFSSVSQEVPIGNLSQSDAPGLSQSEAPGLSQSEAPGLSRSEAPGLSRSEAPGLSQSGDAPLAGKKWAPANAVQQAVLDACRRDFRTVEQIAQTIGRASATVRQNYVPKLVRDGRLGQRYPDAPNHPQQAYQTLTDREPDP